MASPGLGSTSDAASTESPPDSSFNHHDQRQQHHTANGFKTDGAMASSRPPPATAASGSAPAASTYLPSRFLGSCAGYARSCTTQVRTYTGHVHNSIIGLGDTNAARSASRGWQALTHSVSGRWQALNSHIFLGLPLGKALLALTGLLALAAILTGAIVPAIHRGTGQGELTAGRLAPAPGPMAPGQVPGPEPEPGPIVSPGHAPSLESSFVRLNANMQLQADCKPFFIVGFNAYDLTEIASLPADFSGDGGTSGRQLVADTLAQARDLLGVNTVRTWAHTSSTKMPFQVSPGIYSEEGFSALDFILDAASKNGLRVILSLVDNWHYYNGVDWYVDWSSNTSNTTIPLRTYERQPDEPGDPLGPFDKPPAVGAVGGNVTAAGPNMTVPDGFNISLADGLNVSSTNTSALNATELAALKDAQDKYEKLRHTLFWTDPVSKQMYRNHALAITNRRNIYNGRLYRDDPTILAYDLVNEPRCELQPDCHQAVQVWIEEMSVYVKSLAPKQLITIGSEGFFGPSTPELLRFNPGYPGDWAANMGQDFVLNNSPESIDFVTLHAWPDNWSLGNTSYLQFIETWLGSHIHHARYMNHSHLNVTLANSTQQPVIPLRKPILLEEFGKKLVGVLQGPEGILSQRDPVFDWTYQVVQQELILPFEGAVAPTVPTQVATAAATPPVPAGGRRLMMQQQQQQQQQHLRQLLQEQQQQQQLLNLSNTTDNVTAASQKQLEVLVMPLLGSLFWKWQVPVPGFITDEYGVLPNHTTVKVINAHANVMDGYAGSLPPQSSCEPGLTGCWMGASMAIARYEPSQFNFTGMRNDTLANDTVTADGESLMVGAIAGAPFGTVARCTVYSKAGDGTVIASCGAAATASVSTGIAGPRPVWPIRYCIQTPEALGCPAAVRKSDGPDPSVPAANVTNRSTAELSRVFASWEDCCSHGTGAFSRGCSTTPSP